MEGKLFILYRIIFLRKKSLRYELKFVDQAFARLGKQFTCNIVRTRLFWLRLRLFLFFYCLKIRSNWASVCSY